MAQQNSIKRNFIMNTLLTSASMFFPLLTYPYISRVLLADGLGKVQFATTFVSYFALVAQLGIPTYGIRACASCRDNKNELSKLIKELLTINLLMCACVYSIFLIFLFNSPKINNEKTLYIYLSATIWLGTLGMEWLYQGLEKYSYITMRSLIFKTIGVISTFIFVRNRADYIQYAVITVFATSASNILNFIYARKFISFRTKEKLDLKKHIKPILIFFAMTCSLTIYTNLDTIMLGFMTNDSYVGYYNTAIKIKSVLVMVVTSLGTVLLPRAAYYIKNNMIDEFYRIGKKALHFNIMISSAFMVYFTIFAKESIYILSGKTFTASILPMKILMPTILLISITNITGTQILISLGKEKIVLYSELVGAMVDFIINFILIPRFGVSGAAIGTLLAEFVVVLVQIYALKKDFFKLIKNISLGKIFIGLILSGLCAGLMKIIVISPFIKIVISFVIFVTVYLSVLALLKESLILEYIAVIKHKLLVKKACK